ncbi:hypothetical protein [Streptomyces sp. NPDC057557]|uniref:hypothetical protein n=1 Tax=Streptomyces sp. NPDC057557 TaxID=3346167 RepID=UPI0036854EEE
MSNSSELARLAARVALLERQVNRNSRTATLAYSSIEGGAIQVHDDDGRLTGIVGVQADGTTGVVVVNGAPPPSPSTPAATSVLGGISVRWEGTFVDAVAAPLDFARVEVHAATVDGFVPGPETLRTTMESPRGGEAKIVTGEPVYVRLVARNTSGTVGAPSEQSGPVGPATVVAEAVLNGIVDELALAVNAVSEANLQPGSVGSTAIAAGAVTTPHMVAGSINGDRIVARSITGEQIRALSVTAAELAANSVTALQLAAGIVDATHIKAGSINARALSADALNGKVVTGALIQTAESGRRIVLNPAAGSPALQIYSGSPAETAPGGLSSDVIDLGTWRQPEVSVFSPSVSGPGAGLRLRSPESGGQGRVILEPSNQSDGYAHLTVRNGGARADSEVTIYGARASALGGGYHSQVVTGAGITWTSANRQMTLADGVLTAPNIATGAVKIAPTPGVPTSVTVTGLNVAGKSHRAFVTANTTVPGTSVQGVGATGVGGSGLTVWLTRTGSTETTVWWMVVGS